MKFLCLAYGDEDGWNSLREDEKQEVLAQDAVIRDRGNLMAAVQAKVTSVRNWDRVLEVTDEPYAQHNLPLAGFSVIEAANLNEVIELVSNTPCARARGVIDIRPFWEFDEARNRIDRTSDRIRVIFDTDTNNELDDQHALAYLLFNGDAFELEGVTVNATYNGGGIDDHYREAERILELCTLHPRIPLIKGATGSFEEISDHIHAPQFDGSDAVDFIVERALAPSNRRLVLLAVGKLTNIALAYAKNPAIAENATLVWLGSNYPEPGEYNQDNDEEALNFLLDSDLPFEMVVVRYGKPSGTHAVRAELSEIRKRMPGLGPRTKEPVVGRHGIAFSTFGDYSVNLFEHVEYHGDGPPSRALYDMAAVAIVKNPNWAKSRRIPAPILQDAVWAERPGNQRTIDVWEDFDKEAILGDFYRSMKDWALVEPEDGG